MGEDRNLLTTLREIRAGWPALVAALALTCAVALALTTMQRELHAADGEVLVSPARFLDPDGTDALPALTDTVVEIAGTQAVLGPTREAYVAAARDARVRADRASEATPTWLDEHVRVRRVGSSSVVEVRGTAPDSDAALDLTTAAITSLTAFVREARAVEQDDADAGAAVGIGLVVLSRGETAGQVSPTPLRNLLVGINAGLLLGLLAALALGRIRMRRGAARAATDLGVPWLGVAGAGEGTRGAIGRAAALLASLHAAQGRVVVLVTGTVAGAQIAGVAERLVRALEDAGLRGEVVDAVPGAHAEDGGLGIGGNGASIGGPRLWSGLDAVRSDVDVVVLAGPLVSDLPDLVALIAAAQCSLLVTEGTVSPQDLDGARLVTSRTPLMGVLGVDGRVSAWRPAASPV